MRVLVLAVTGIIAAVNAVAGVMMALTPTVAEHAPVISYFCHLP